MITQAAEIRKQIFRSMCLYDLPDILLGLAAGYHDLVPASFAFQAKIRTDAQNLPFPGTAGMLLLKF
jgi:hypothetical protein